MGRRVSPSGSKKLYLFPPAHALLNGIRQQKAAGKWHHKADQEGTELAAAIEENQATGGEAQVNSGRQKSGSSFGTVENQTELCQSASSNPWRDRNPKRCLRSSQEEAVSVQTSHPLLAK